MSSMQYLESCIRILTETERIYIEVHSEHTPSLLVGESWPGLSDIVCFVKFACLFVKIV